MTETREPRFTVGQLAGMIDVNPDNYSTSAGALWLADTADTWLNYDRGEAIEYGTDIIEALYQCAENAVPIYNGPRWSVFTDLGAWQFSEEIADDFGGLPKDMTAAAGVILHELAERLLHAIESEREDDDENDDDTED